MTESIKGFLKKADKAHGVWRICEVRANAGSLQASYTFGSLHKFSLVEHDHACVFPVLSWQNWVVGWRPGEGCCYIAIPSTASQAHLVSFHGSKTVDPAIIMNIVTCILLLSEYCGNMSC